MWCRITSCAKCFQYATPQPISYNACRSLLELARYLRDQTLIYTLCWSESKRLHLASNTCASDCEYAIYYIVNSSSGCSFYCYSADDTINNFFYTKWKGHSNCYCLIVRTKRWGIVLLEKHKFSQKYTFSAPLIQKMSFSVIIPSLCVQWIIQKHCKGFVHIQ